VRRGVLGAAPSKHAQAQGRVPQLLPDSEVGQPIHQPVDHERVRSQGGLEGVVGGVEMVNVFRESVVDLSRTYAKELL
jgi:hypothetical protein